MFAKRRIRKHGLQAQAQVVAVQDRVATGGGRTSTFELEVRPTDRAAFPAELTEKFGPGLQRPEEDDLVGVLYDPKDLTVVLDLSGDDRFDPDAVRARAKQHRKDARR